VEETAREFGKSVEEATRLLPGARRALFQARARRPRPDLDDKILTSWNGLMISALAKGSQILGEEGYLQGAEKAARFLRSKLYDPSSKRLFHRWRENQRAVPGMAEDYAFLVQGLLDLYEACFDPVWLEWAAELTETQNRLFLAPEGGYYATAEGHDANLLTRVMDDTDNVEPGPASIAALNLLRLHEFTGRKEFRTVAEATLERFGAKMRDHPLSLPQMLVALDFALGNPRQVVIAGDPGEARTRALLKEFRARFVPVSVLIVVPEGPAGEKLRRIQPFLENLRPLDGKPTAYVCVGYACDLPTSDPKVLAAILEGKTPTKKD